MRRFALFFDRGNIGALASFSPGRTSGASPIVRIAFLDLAAIINNVAKSIKRVAIHKHLIEGRFRRPCNGVSQCGSFSQVYGEKTSLQISLSYLTGTREDKVNTFSVTASFLLVYF